MKNTTGKTSPKKEIEKVQTDKQFKDDEIRGDENNSIHGEDNSKSGDPYESKEDKQYKTQPEFIDRNSNSKDKS